MKDDIVSSSHLIRVFLVVVKLEEWLFLVCHRAFLCHVHSEDDQHVMCKVVGGCVMVPRGM